MPQATKRELRLAKRHGIEIVGNGGYLPVSGRAIVAGYVLDRPSIGVRFTLYRDGRYKGAVTALGYPSRFATWRRRREAFNFAVEAV